MTKESLGNRIILGTLWKFGERMTAQGVSFIVTLLLTRILLPNDYGIIAIINVFINLADVLLNSGLNTALIQKKDATSLDFNTIFWCNLLLGFILYAVLFILSPYIAKLYNMPVLTITLRVLSLRLPISAFQSIQSAYVSRKLQFKKFFHATTAGAVVSAIVGVIMAYSGFGVWALIAQYLVNIVVSTLTLFLVVDWRPKLEFSKVSAIPLVGYAWKVMLTDLIGTIFNNLGDLIIGINYSASSLAYYSKGRQLPYLIRNNVFSSLTSVLFPGLSNVNDDLERVKEIARKSTRILSYVLFPIMMGLIVTSRTLTTIMYTEKWLPIIPFVIIICIEAMLSILPTVSFQVIKAIGRSDLMLKFEFIKKPILLLAIVFAVQYGVLAIAMTTIANTLLDICLNGYLMKKLIGYSILEQLEDILSATLLTLTMGGAVCLISFLDLNIFLLLAIQITLGTTVYVVLSILVKQQVFEYLKNKFLNR